MNNYAFTDTTGATLDLNLIKRALASQNSSLQGLVSKTQVSLVNAVTLPASPPRGYAQLMATPGTGAFSPYVGHMAIWLDGHWLFVPPAALGDVAQNYRSAQYSYNTGTNIWDETITDLAAEGGVGLMGPAGPHGDPNNVSKFAGAGAVTRNGRVLTSPKVYYENNSFYGLDSGTPGVPPGRILIGFPILHVLPPSNGDAYYLVCRVNGGSAFAASSLRGSTNDGSRIPRNSRVRFVGMCTEDREITTAAQQTDVVPYKYSTDCILREDTFYKFGTTSSGIPKGGRAHSGIFMLIFRGPGANFYIYNSMSSLTGATARGAGNTFVYDSIYIDTGQHLSTLGPVGGTRLHHFREQTEYQLLDL